MGLVLSAATGAGARAAVNGTGRLVFNIVDYGARRDALAPATAAFQRAIAAARAAGGGTIYVPPGRYSSGPIELFSNMTLDVDAGATIAFPVAALPFTWSRYLGVEALVPMPLVGGHDVENVTVTGRGTLTTGDYEQWRQAYPAAYQDYLRANQGRVSTGGDATHSANGPHWDQLLRVLEAGRRPTNAEYRAAAPELRPSFICFQHARNVLVQDIRIVGAPMFVVHLLYSDYATVRNVMIETYPGPHANGIVVDSSRFVRVSGCYVDTGDDGIVIKAGKDADGLRVNRPSEDIVITNCTVHHAHGAVVIGSETAGSIRNVTASNVVAVDTENGIRIKSRRGRGGVVEDVRFDGWTMRHVGTGIVVTSHYVMGGEGATRPQPVSRGTPVFRDIAISDVTIDGARRVAEIDWLPEKPIEGLRIVDVVGSGGTGLSARHTDALELHDLQVNAAAGPAFAIADATNLELDDVTTRQPYRDAPVVQLTRCPGAILRGSRAFPGTAVFLATGPGELSSVHLVDNVLDNARTPAEQRPK